MVRIAVFVSGSGTNLQSLIDACKNKTINGKISLVISSKEKAYGLVRALNENIKAEFIKDEDLILKRLEKQVFNNHNDTYETLLELARESSGKTILSDKEVFDEIRKINLESFIAQANKSSGS